MFKVLHSGKRRKKQWKRMVTKVTFVGPSFTRKPPKYERFIRPSGEDKTPYIPAGPSRASCYSESNGASSGPSVSRRSLTPQLAPHVCTAEAEDGRYALV